MKKVKLMLMSLSVLAVVGGALAFTAKQGTPVCTANTILNQNNQITCPNFCPSKAALKSGSPTDNLCSTTTSGNPLAPCPSDIHCFTTNPGKTIQ